MLLGW